MGKKRKIIKLIFLILITVFAACNKQVNSDTDYANTNEDSLDNIIETVNADSIENTQDVVEINTPKLSIIIDDFGNYNNFMIDSLLVKFGNLPTEVAFAIIPNLPYSQVVMEYFAFDNRELLLHTPLEPQNSKINAGDVVINASDDAITIINKLNDFHTQLPNVIGLNNHMGSKTTESVEAMTAVLEWCKANNLYFVDSATTSKSIAFALAQELGVPTAKRDIFLDVPNPSRETVDNYLTKMQKYFDSDKNILVITHASSLERRNNLIYFIKEAQEIGYSLVPVSEYLTVSEEEAI